MSFEELIKIESLYRFWRHFRRGKRRRSDVMRFEAHLEHELISLAADLARGSYAHGGYERFPVNDPKRRMVHKASVRDRVVHQMVYESLLPLFEKKFLFDSYAARRGKGTHCAIDRLRSFIRSVSGNGRRPCFVFHGDVSAFFENVNHDILLGLLRRRVDDRLMLALCREIIASFSVAPSIGMPLGNLTSQLFANVYLHELDFFAKHGARASHYVRYNDDFFLVADNREHLIETGKRLVDFLSANLLLAVPSHKMIVRSLGQGVDTLGAVLFSWGAVVRRRVEQAALRCSDESARVGYTTLGSRRGASYLGHLSHTRSFYASERVRLAALRRCV